MHRLTSDCPHETIKVMYQLEQGTLGVVHRDDTSRGIKK